ncbi:hypothetical protein ACH5RR_021209 [Cinchona calisaya]|uniref:Late embryogenesis abundant protein LEA-2 subgroup domain-containing protein n=1 Tax=Cinchona calisaya TaxID=153742 RepID=A0ABD2ZJX3_9GENT
MADPNNRPVTGYPYPSTNGHPPPPPSTTSYPYAAPPPPTYYNQQYYPAYHNPDPDAIRRATFVRRLFAFLIAGVIIFGTVLFIIWLVIRPRFPDFRVDSISVSNFNLSSNTLVSADFDVKITARNPNGKITLFFDHIEAAVYFQNYQLSSTTLPPFSQGKKNETSMTAELAVVKAYLDGDVVNGINGERGKDGNVGFNVRMLMGVEFKAGAWRTRKRYLKAFCGDLSVRVSGNSTNGTLIGGPKQCHVGI